MLTSPGSVSVTVDSKVGTTGTVAGVETVPGTVSVSVVTLASVVPVAIVMVIDGLVSSSSSCVTAKAAPTPSSAITARPVARAKSLVVRAIGRAVAGRRRSDDRARARETGSPARSRRRIEAAAAGGGGRSSSSDSSDRMRPFSAGSTSGTSSTGGVAGVAGARPQTST